MQREEMIQAIKKVLEENMQNSHMALFSPSAKLNEELYLDSVLILQLILHLELDLGLTVPEQHITAADYATVASLADFLCQVNNESELAPKEPEVEFEDVKVHCFVSCVCEALKSKGIDHRPFYFAVWDATFDVSERYQLQYHSDDINHQLFIDWYQRLFGGELIAWYDSEKTKLVNLATMRALLGNKSNSEHLMVMLDLYHLPERENKFNQNPFPHYVMLTETETPEHWMMWDPDFRWQGEISQDRIENAISQPTVEGGYIFNENALQDAPLNVVQDYFKLCFIEDENPLTNAVREIIQAHLDEKQGISLSDLPLALRELKVIAVRKYAYEHGFAYFGRALGQSDDDFEYWCDVIEELIQTYTSIQYQVMKMAETKDLNLYTGIQYLLDKQDRTEKRIKKGLFDMYSDWCELNDLPCDSIMEVC
ncbi:DUF6005 family protein [Photobacterium angustum]|uniref:DUF6005 family protein n=1 Tax=Photobacterium angustum TaxID=661 RepID=UPI0005E40851|nr:DUF6005 family protein [Photobacterium angustum]KJG04313.1 phosphopantetheine-binding protein [Photobacterium angustum]KJG18044.1 phosphopantetheine-binding protein [Photobacterium angustum]KJG26137.1 phosphopantetheine-binding protein [Photobacterium angustum]KJG32149.1 phosphopantetheine-binding protein [Photobacterium angustum]PSV90184.1 phosphopantetheine-binding protein [Photobacterium angustum]